MIKVRNSKELNAILNEYSYGILIDGYPETDDAKINWMKYRSMSVKEFEKHRIGCCWDYVMYEHYWFKANDIPHKLFYIEGGRNQDTHTFLVYEENNKYLLFESSWKEKCGVYEFKTLDDLLMYYSKEFTKYFDKEYKRYVLYEYEQPKTGITCTEFMTHIYKNGIMKRNVGMYYEILIKPWKDCNFVNYYESSRLQTFDYKWKNVLDIIKTLPEDEQKYFNTRWCPMNIIGRYVHRIPDIGDIGFIDILKLYTKRGYSNSIAIISYAIKKEYRNREFSNFLLNVGIKIAQDKGFKELQCRVTYENIQAIQAIEKSNLFKVKKRYKDFTIYSRDI